MDLDLTESASERDVVLRIKILLREEQHEMLEPKSAKVLPSLVVEIVQIDPSDLGPQGTGDRAHLDA